MLNITDEEILNERLDDVDALMNDMIDYTNLNAADIRATISAETQAVGYSISSNMAAILAGNGPLGTIVTAYGNGLNSQFNTANAQLGSVNTVLNSILSNVASLVAQGNAAAAAKAAQVATVTPVATSVVVPATQTTITAPAVVTNVATSTSSSRSSKKSSSSKTSSTKSTNTVSSSLAKAVSDTVKTVKNVVKTVNSVSKVSKIVGSVKKAIGFSEGGYVADMQKIAYQNGDNMVTFNTLKKGEAIFTEAQYAQMSKLVDNLPQIQGLVDTTSMLKPLYSGNVGAATTHIDVGGINIPIDHVEDYDDLVRHMRDDKQFERFIDSLTIDKLGGKSSINKKRYYA